MTGKLAVFINILKLSLSYDLTMPFLNLLFQKDTCIYAQKSIYKDVHISVLLLTEKLNAGYNPNFYH